MNDRRNLMELLEVNIASFGKRIVRRPEDFELTRGQVDEDAIEAAASELAEQLAAEFDDAA